MSKIPSNANVIGSHALNKIEVLDYGELYCKEIIAPHGNYDKKRSTLKTDSLTCPLIGFCMLLSVPVLMRWNLTKVDVKSAFLQYGEASRDAYVKPPR